MNLDIISHISAAEKAALPPIPDADLATRLEAFLGFDLGAYQPDLDVGIECFALLVKALPSYAGRLPEPWRDVAYRWIELWIETSVPVAESAPVLAELEASRTLLQGDEASLRSAVRLFGHLPTEPAGVASEEVATEEQIQTAASLVRQFSEERGDGEFSQRSLLMFASQIQALPFAAAAPHLSSLLEAGRTLWDAQRIYEINEALLEIMQNAPSAEVLAEALRPCQQGPFLKELRMSAPHLAPGCVALRGIQLALA